MFHAGHNQDHLVFTLQNQLFMRVIVFIHLQISESHNSQHCIDCEHFTYHNFTHADHGVYAELIYFIILVLE